MALGLTKHRILRSSLAYFYDIRKNKKLFRDLVEIGKIYDLSLEINSLEIIYFILNSNPLITCLIKVSVNDFQR